MRVFGVAALAVAGWALSAAGLAAAEPPLPAIRIIGGEGDAAVIVFGPGKTVPARLLGAIGSAEVTPLDGGEPISLGMAMGQPKDSTPIVGYALTGPAFEGAPLCPSGQARSIAVMYPDGAPEKLAVVSGAAPGAKGARLCALGDAKVVGP